MSWAILSRNSQGLNINSVSPLTEGLEKSKFDSTIVLKRQLLMCNNSTLSDVCAFLHLFRISAAIFAG